MFDKGKKQIENLDYEVKKLKKIIDHAGLFCDGEGFYTGSHPLNYCPYGLNELQEDVKLIKEYLKIEIQRFPAEKKVIKKRKPIT